jgi:hypothetical protein
MSEEPLPPYTYTPGATPHPISDPDGHSHGRTATPAAIDSERLLESPAFRRGVELFRSGYYWEAHEEWESIWHAAGRRGAVADFLKGLIKLAAAGVKAREGNADGVRRHARRAVELLSSVMNMGSSDPMLDHKALAAITDDASTLAESTTIFPRLDHGRPVIFWPELAGKVDRL